MKVHSYYLECLSHASYMVADEATGTAAVIDPQRDIDQYVADAQRHGLTIRHVILTHFHADFVAGHIELRDRFGAEIALGARAEAEFEFRSLRDGDAIEFGTVRLVALETPGHTPEGISLLAFDTSRDREQPQAVFTGDTLFIGDVGRPDLMASVGVTADELASMLYDSLHEKLLPLPDETRVYPAHGAGSMCGRQLGDDRVSTIGEQRRDNYALQPMTREQFIELVGGDQPEAPSYFGHDAMVNRQDRATLDESLVDSLQALPLDQLLVLQQDGAQIVDVRDPREFAAAHLRGAINIGIDGKYATWAGTILRRDVPIAVISESDRVHEAVMRLGRIGFDHVVGYLQDGMASLRGHDELIATTSRISATTAAEELDAVTIVDVRTAAERAAGIIGGSLAIPLNQLPERLGEVPRDGRVIVHCQGGYRSSIAASLLRADGRDNVVDLVGGYKAWVTAGLPVTEPMVTAE